MAMPQNLSFPRIITVGVIGTLLVTTTVVGTIAFYNFWNHGEEERWWSNLPPRPIDVLKQEQRKPQLEDNRLDSAMGQIIANRGKLPATQPGQPSSQPTGAQNGQPQPQADGEPKNVPPTTAPKN